MVSHRRNGIYRGIVFALAGLALVGAGEAPQKGTQPKQHRADSNGTKASPKTARPSTKAAQPVEPPEYYQPCGKQGSEGNSDLCAQWSAAKAAGNAARWAWWQLWLSFAGVIGLGITLWFNFRALRLAERESEETKGALAIAARSADAATKLAEISEKTAEKQLRAYLSVASLTLVEFEWDEGFFGLNFVVTNNGQTPANMKKMVFRALWVFEGGSANLIEYDQEIIVKCHKATPINMPLSFEGDFEGREKEGHLLAFGRIEYRDVFGKSQKETFGFRTSEFREFGDLQLPLKLSAYSIETVLSQIKRNKEDTATNKS